MTKGNQELILKALERLEAYIISEGYRGYDPFDGLMSPILHLPFLRSSKPVRFVTQQVLKRVPFNVRPLIGIRKGLNPVTLGLCIQSFTYLAEVFREKKDFYLMEIRKCLKYLKELRSPGYSNACWGYDFDWEARYAKIPAFAPTVVATGIIENALYEYYLSFRDEEAKDLILSAAEFVEHDLNRTHKGDGFCFSYSPNDNQIVFNATMKGARILSHAYAISRDGKYAETAERTVRFVVDHQNEDGSWYYSFQDARRWIDNFHTAYVLDCMKDYCDVVADDVTQACLARGLKFYEESFFTDDGVTKYYHDSVYPVDSTAAAQSLLTLCRFGGIDAAQRTAEWMIVNMQDPSGYFYYQKMRFLTNRISYMRWSNAWMFAGLTYLLTKLKCVDVHDMPSHEKFDISQKN